MSEAEAVAAEAEAMADAEAESDAPQTRHPENKDDTGIGNPWGLPKSDPEDGAFEARGNGSTGLLPKVGR